MKNNEIKKLVNDAISYYYDESFCLSIFLSKLLQIAIKTNDSTLKFLVRLEMNSADSEMNKRNRSEFRQEMLNQGSSDNFMVNYKSLINDYLKRREFPSDEENILSLSDTNSIETIETQIISYQTKIQSLEIPEGLASLDLYYLTIENKKLTSFLISTISKKQAILSRIKTFFFDYLLNIDLQKINQHQIKEETKYNMPVNNKIFVIHGSDEAKRRELTDLLRRMGFEPVVLADEPGRSNSIFEKFKEYASQCSAAIALITADDKVESKEGEQYTQGRPNVWFELGWFYARIGRENTILLYEDSANHSIPSDLYGISQVRYMNNVEEAYKKLEDEFKTMGLGKIDLS